MIYINDDVVMVYILSHVISRSFPTLALQLMITGSFYVTKVLSSYRSLLAGGAVGTGRGVLPYKSDRGARRTF